MILKSQEVKRSVSLLSLLRYAKLIGMMSFPLLDVCRGSSVVEQLHGKQKVESSNLSLGFGGLYGC